MPLGVGVALLVPFLRLSNGALLDIYIYFNFPMELTVNTKLASVRCLWTNIGVFFKSIFAGLYST